MSVLIDSVANGHVNGNGDISMEQAGARFASGLILPPPEIKCKRLSLSLFISLTELLLSAVIDRTAVFVARSANPPQFEDKIREGQRSDPKFSFLNPADPYHAYYRDKMDKVLQGDMSGEATQEKEEKGTEGEAIEPQILDIGLEPPAPVFTLDMPNVTSIDLYVSFITLITSSDAVWCSDIIKMTALFTARRGHSFLNSLSMREGRNYQFDFLRPHHSLFGYFNRLVEQYTKVLFPDKEMLEQLKSRTSEGARWRTLEIAKRHAKWERTKREKDKKRQDDQEAERSGYSFLRFCSIFTLLGTVAFAEIDWHDYAIVQTIEFTAADANTELPPPMSVQEVESMTLAQKRMAAMIMENTVDDVEAHRARQAAAEAEAAAAVGNAGMGGGDDDAAMEESDDEGEAEERKRREEEQRLREIERAKVMQASSNTAGPMKIRTDYVPKRGSTLIFVCGFY